MAERNMLQTLFADRVDQSELERVLIAHFHQASSPEVDEVFYPREAQHALKLTYRDGTLVEILPGPGLQPSDIDALREKIASNLLTPGIERYGRAVCFAGVPVTGFFAYRDRFQIIPVPKEAPRPNFLIGDHPFYIEFKFRDNPDVMIASSRRARTAGEIELLGTALVNHFGRSHGYHRHHWVWPDPMPAQPVSQYLQEGYTWPGISPVSDKVTPTDGIDALKMKDPQAYYAQRGIGVDPRLALPSNLVEQLDRYFGLPRVTQETFLRACFWLRHSQSGLCAEVGDGMKG